MNGSVMAVSVLDARSFTRLDQVFPGFEPVLARVDQPGVFLGERSLSNFVVSSIRKARMPFANLFQRRRAGRFARSQQAVHPVRDPGHVRHE